MFLLDPLVAPRIEYIDSSERTGVDYLNNGRVGSSYGSPIDRIAIRDEFTLFWRDERHGIRGYGSARRRLSRDCACFREDGRMIDG